MKPLAFRKKGEIGTSMRQSGRSSEKISQNARYFFKRANEAAHKGDYLQALEYYDHALSTDPHYAGAWHEKGTCLDELGWWEEALASYDEALMNDPCNPETWFRKGLILKRSGREDEAYQLHKPGHRSFARGDQPCSGSTRSPADSHIAIEPIRKHDSPSYYQRSSIKDSAYRGTFVHRQQRHNLFSARDDTLSMDDSTSFFEADVFARQTGIELVEVSQGRARVKMEIGEQHMNSHRTVHGGLFSPLPIQRLRLLQIRTVSLLRQSMPISPTSPLHVPGYCMLKPRNLPEIRNLPVILCRLRMKMVRRSPSSRAWYTAKHLVDDILPAVLERERRGHGLLCHFG